MEHPPPPGPAPFPPTRHSVLAALSSPDEVERTRAYEMLVAAYWKPAYKYVRLKWRLNGDDAADGVQEFFSRAWLKGVLERFDPARARFRTYLRLCLDGFFSNERKAAGRLKRGGGAHLESLDFVGADGELRRLELRAPGDPEAVFHDEWVRQIFALALADLEAECAAAGKAVHCAVFRAYDVDADETTGRPTYDALAQQHGVPVTQVTNYLSWARRRFRARVLDRLRELSATEAEYRADVRELLGLDPPAEPLP